MASAQADLATDFDRNRNAMIESGRLSPEATKVVWTSDPLPNHAIAVRKGLDPVGLRSGRVVLDRPAGELDEPARAVLYAVDRPQSGAGPQTPHVDAHIRSRV